MGGSEPTVVCKLEPMLPAVEFCSGAEVADEPEAEGRGFVEPEDVLNPAVGRGLDEEAVADVEAVGRRWTIGPAESSEAED